MWEGPDRGHIETFDAPVADVRRTAAFGGQQPQDVASLLTIRYIHSSVYA
jgi:hypothetical protein